MEVCAKAQALSWRKPCAAVGRASCLDGPPQDAVSPHCRQLTPICNLFARSQRGCCCSRQVVEAVANSTDVVLRIDVQGAATVRAMMPDAVSVFLVRLRTADHHFLASTDIAQVCILSHTLYSRAATAPGMTPDAVSIFLVRVPCSSPACL